MENEEIDLIEVMAKLWHRKRTIMYIALFFLVGGLVLAFFLPRKYTAQCTLGLEMEDRTTRISVEGMSPFQSMPMGDMRNTRIVSPAMYPDIFFSVPFQKELIYSPLYIDERGDTVTFYNYLVSGPERLALVADPSQVEQLTEEESKCLAYLKDAFSVKVNNKDGNLKITLDLPDPKLSAYLTNRAQAMLQTYIARFRIAKAQAALDFAEERYTEVKNELEKKQQALVQFREKHPDRTSVQLETEEKILTNDYELFFGLYSDIDMISSLCNLMARGAIISMFTVIFMLPSMFMIFDKLICHTSVGFTPESAAKEAARKARRHHGSRKPKLS